MAAEVATRWFRGSGRTDDDETYLAALRAVAVAGGLVDATPVDTALHVWKDALVATVRVPGAVLGRSGTTLQVAVDPKDPHRMSCGCKTYGYLDDGDAELDLAGVQRTPEGLGHHAGSWLGSQLRRPVEQLSWETWRGVRGFLRFADDGELIASDFTRLPRRPPDRVLPLRPAWR